MKPPRLFRLDRVAALLGAILLGEALPASVRAQAADAPFPIREQPVNYYGDATREAVARLRGELEGGRTTLSFEPGRGYLGSLLTALHVPVESQVLVFSKTSVNARLIGPRTPRAIYFNDQVYVGWAPGAPALEITAIDPVKGAIFYTLPQQKDAAPPRLAREESCLLCHVSSNSLQVPGQLVRSFLTDDVGNPTHGYSRVTHDTPFEKRWGGWYVTGTYAGLHHLGNLTTDADRRQHKLDPVHGGNLADLRDRFDAAKYLSPHSDVVALMLLDHQTNLHNLLTRVSYEERFQRKENSEEQLLRYLLFVDAAPLAGPVKGTTGYAAWFEKQGPRDRQGRSLRQLDLQTRLVKYRCSYLIDSPAFDELPAAVKSRLYHRLHEVLTGRDPSPHFAAIPPAERQAILEILRDTKRDLPAEWRM